MSQYDYNTSVSQGEQPPAPKFGKVEDKGLPEFAKEIPLRTIVKRHRNSVTVEYEWNVLGGEEIKIKVANFKGDENLQYVHKIRITDGEEVGSFTIANTTYIIRKTTEDVAKELMKTSGKIKASILGVIGYFKTVKGNCYTVSKVEGEAWALDGRLGLKTLSASSMEEVEKRKLTDLILEEFFKLYRQGYALRDFNLMDVIVAKKKIVFGNAGALIKVSAAKTVDNLAANLKVLVRSGMAKKGDVVYGIALSFGIMKKEYSEWVKENGVESKDEVEVLEKIENDILN